jgi:hypothetical protein
MSSTIMVPRLWSCLLTQRSKHVLPKSIVAMSIIDHNEAVREGIFGSGMDEIAETFLPPTLGVTILLQDKSCFNRGIEVVL